MPWDKHDGEDGDGTLAVRIVMECPGVFHSMYSMSLCIVNELDSLLSTALHSAEVLKWQRMARNLEDSCDHHETQCMASQNEKVGPESVRRSPILNAQTSKHTLHVLH